MEKNDQPKVNNNEFDGEANPAKIPGQKRISEQERAGIRADYGVLKWREIQKKYQVSPRTIARIVSDLVEEKVKK